MTAETDAYVGIIRLQQAYADVCNRRAFAELERLLLPDAVIDLAVAGSDAMQIVGPTELGRFIGASLERFEFFEFVVLTTHVEIAPDAASAAGRVWMSELRQDAAGGRFTTVYGLYQDRYVQTGDTWRFAHREYSSLARTGGRDVDVFGLPGLRAF
jgi:hypothetical protein